MDFESDNFGVFASSRRSTRDFLPTPIPDEIIEEIIADGLTSPSWSNTRPIRVAVAKGDVRERLSKEFLLRWEAIKGARSGWLGKIKAVLKRKGLPTSNWIITRPYHKDSWRGPRTKEGTSTLTSGSTETTIRPVMSPGPEIMTSSGPRLSSLSSHTSH